MVTIAEIGNEIVGALPAKCCCRPPVVRDDDVAVLSPRPVESVRAWHARSGPSHISSCFSLAPGRAARVATARIGTAPETYARVVELDEWLDGTDALSALDAAYQAVWTATDPDLLGVCQIRMAMLLRHEPTLRDVADDQRTIVSNWPTATGLTELQRAALAFTEQYIIDVASLTDEIADAVRTHMSDEAFATFVNALLVLEQRMSLELVLAGVL